jgi:hypothetical protein
MSLGWPKGNSNVPDLDTGGKHPWWYYPENPTRFDDDFMGDSLDPKWTIAQNGIDSYEVADGFLIVRGGSATGQLAMVQPMPTGAWAASTRIIGAGGNYTYGNGGGPIAADSNTSTGYQWMSVGNPATSSGNTAYYTNNNRLTNYGYAGDWTYILQTMYPEFHRIAYDGAGTLTASYSFNGASWTVYGSIGSTAPTHVGFMVNSFNNDAGSGAICIVDSFRMELL